MAVNAKFIHSSLAIRSLKAYSTYKEHIKLQEFTINQQENLILSEIYKTRPQIIGFSCYIWNIEMILSLVNNLKKILPNAVIILGGPEVSFETEELFKENAVDIVIKGEGEQTFHRLMQYYIDNKGSLEEINGIVFKKDGELIQTKPQEPLKSTEIPFPYQDEPEFPENKILYYESSRGCPNNCGYCLSSTDKALRFLRIERVCQELQRFLDAKVTQVKFIDRTFNANKSHTMQIWKYLKEHDNGITNFHFEICADLLTDEMTEFLKTIRKGYFQFEIGVQSTNKKTLEYINRRTDLDKLFQRTREISAFGNIHQHLDLIAGLPFEGLESFRNSFNEVYAAKPEMLQLGFLKLLKGSQLRDEAEKLGIVFKDKADYEVLYTKELSHDDLLLLKSVENVLELFYNSQKINSGLSYIMQYENAFDFYEKLGRYWDKNQYNLVSHGRVALYTLFREFIEIYYQKYLPQVTALLKFDLCLTELTKNLPPWAVTEFTQEERQKINEIYTDDSLRNKYFPQSPEKDRKALYRKSHGEIFEYNVLNWVENQHQPLKERTLILFDHNNKSGVYTKIPLSSHSSNN